MIKECPEFRDDVTFVPNKKTPVYNWYYYKEGFSRNFVFHYLRKWKPKSVLDPFCGVGTTLLASKESGIPSAGIDMNPVALLASQAKTRNYSRQELEQELEYLMDAGKMDDSYPKWMKRYFPGRSLDEMWSLRSKILDMDENQEFFMLALISSAYKASWMYKDGAVVKVRKRPVPPFRKFFFRTLRKMIAESEYYIGPEADVFAGDARKFDLRRKFDAIITSPPYVNKIEYAKIYRVENEILGKTGFSPVRSFISSDPSSYFSDMEMAISQMRRHLNQGGRVSLVVAGAVLPDGRNIESDTIIADIMQDHGFEVESICVARKRVATRMRTIKIGESRESIIEARLVG